MPAKAESKRSDWHSDTPRAGFPFGPAAAAWAIFALVGASLGSFVASLALPRFEFAAFFEHNQLDGDVRKHLLRGLLLGALVTGSLALAYLALRRRAGVAPLRQASLLILPLGVAFLLPSLFAYEPWHSKPLTYLVQLACVVLVFEQVLRRFFDAIPEAIVRAVAEGRRLSSRMQRALPVITVLAGCTAYAVYFSHYTLLNHHRLGTAAYDLGINVNWCFNAMHGFPQRSTVLFGPEGGYFLGNHAIFGMALWLPLYALHPGAEVLLIFQATIAGFAGLTLYLFAATQLPRWSAVLVAYAYLLFAPLHGPNFYDYHELLPPLFFHFLLYWAIFTRRDWLVVPTVIALWSFREDVAVGLTVLGIFLAITDIRARLGLVLAATSAVWFVLIKFVIMPHYWVTWFDSIYKELQAPHETGYATVVETILINPSYFLTTLLHEEKLIYFLHMFAPLALLPARRWQLLLLAIPGFAFSLMTTGYGPTLSIGFQYTCHTIPYVFAASVLMLRLLGRGEGGATRRRAALGAIALGVLAHSYVFGAVLQHHTFVGGFQKIEFEMTPEEQHRYETIKRMAALIPQDASVVATENENPHIAARMDAYTLRDSPVNVDADFILVNRTRVSTRAAEALTTMMTHAHYGLLTEGDGLYLFKRDLKSGPATKHALKTLGVHRVPAF